LGTVTLVNGVITYTPKAGAVGADSFTYIASDGLSDSNPATVNITIVNRPPAAINDSASTRKAAPVTITVLANDSDPDKDPLSIIAWTQGASGTVVLDNGSLIYTPRKGFTGTDTFTYTISDGIEQATATVTVTVKS
jgi:hypothetical protein